eukprot:3556301-Prymnesium_polylepis.1
MPHDVPAPRRLAAAVVIPNRPHLFDLPVKLREIERKARRQRARHLCAAELAITADVDHLEPLAWRRLDRRNAFVSRPRSTTERTQPVGEWRCASLVDKVVARAPEGTPRRPIPSIWSGLLKDDTGLPAQLHQAYRALCAHLGAPRRMRCCCRRVLGRRLSRGALGQRRV